jgi:hypothetical protein
LVFNHKNISEFHTCLAARECDKLLQHVAKRLYLEACILLLTIQRKEYPKEMRVAARTLFYFRNSLFHQNMLREWDANLRINKCYPVLAHLISRIKDEGIIEKIRQHFSSCANAITKHFMSVRQLLQCGKALANTIEEKNPFQPAKIEEMKEKLKVLATTSNDDLLQFSSFVIGT